MVLDKLKAGKIWCAGKEVNIPERKNSLLKLIKSKVAPVYKKTESIGTFFRKNKSLIAKEYIIKHD
jgi:hypothetical protein